MSGVPTPPNGSATHDQWGYPYQQPQQAPWPAQVGAPAPAQPVAPPQTFVAPSELAPVEPPAEPRYLAPTRAPRDQRRTTLAAVITFIAVVIGLWAILGFLGSVAKTLASVSDGTAKLQLQLAEANTGLAKLDTQTKPLNDLAGDTTELKTLLAELDGGMGGMLVGIDSIAASMTSMDGSLTTLDGELGKLNTANTSVAERLSSINTGLGAQQKSVAGMRVDVVKTGTELGGLTPRLKATNSRLTHLNGVVNFMGCRGIQQKLDVKITAAGFNTGTGNISATIVPPGAWGTNADGSPCL